MVILSLIGLTIACVFIFTGKAMADITSNETHWEQSIFSKFPIDSFWGAKEKTYIRKNNNNKIINWLLHNPFVFVTDIWHLSNTIRRIGIYLSVFFSILVGKYMSITPLNISIILVSFIILNLFGFPWLYHYILRKKKEH